MYIKYICNIYCWSVQIKYNLWCKWYLIKLVYGFFLIQVRNWICFQLIFIHLYRFIQYYSIAIIYTTINFHVSKKNSPLISASTPIVRHWILNYVNGIKRVKDLSPYQNGCPTIIPNLRAFPFWDTSLFPWVKELESKFKEIKEELLSLKGQQGIPFLLFLN